MRALALAVALVAAASCGGSDRAPFEEEGDGLGALVLRPDEAPSGLELDEETGGPIDSVRELLPPRTDAPQLPSLPKTVLHAFLGGYDAVYAGNPDTGPTSASSSVIRFSASDSAAAFLAYLRKVQSEAITVGSSEIVETPGLGEEGYGWHRSAPGGETAGCSWRRGDLVLTLTLGGPLGRAPVQQAIELARRLDARLAVAE